MDIFFGNFFWGILIILLGISIILKGFGISLPLVKVFFAIIIIMFGIKLLIGGKASIRVSGKHHHKGNSVVYSNNHGEYTMVFSSGVIDLTDMPEDARDLEVTVVFGSATVYLPSDVDFDIDPTTVFGATVMPRKVRLAVTANSRKVAIESNAVFGRLEYMYKDRPFPSGYSSSPADSSATPGEF